MGRWFMTGNNDGGSIEHSGYVQAISPDGARRQFRMSVALVLAFAISTFVAAMLGGIRLGYIELEPPKLTVETPGTMKLRKMLPGLLSLKNV